MKMKNVTYVFGAGASKNALPILKEIPSRMNKLIKLFRKDRYNLTDEIINPDRGITTKEILKDFIRDLKWLSNESNNTSTDTFAKKLYLNKNKSEELIRLKTVLSAYLILEQALNPFDKRYDSFIASLLNDSINSFPKNVKIISWNYDYQFEKAYCEYTDIPDIYNSQNCLNVISKHKAGNVDPNKFAIFKINGTSGFINQTNSKHINFIQNISEKLNKELIEKVLYNYYSILNNTNLFPTLSFAWEEGEFNAGSIIEKTIQCTNSTNILVIIGYSIPFFNREIDRKIIEKMENLEKVYFQSPEASNLKDRFYSIIDFSSKKELELIPIKDTEQFFLPNEL